MATKKIYCCNCESDIKAQLINGSIAYPYITRLSHIPFWRCPNCLNFVGTHHKTKERLKPLGCIPTREIKDLRKKIHAKIDPLWKSGKYTRGGVYIHISMHLGYEYHTAELRSVEECNKVLSFVDTL